jgi:hypothetical protein
MSAAWPARETSPYPVWNPRAQPGRKVPRSAHRQALRNSTPPKNESAQEYQVQSREHEQNADAHIVIPMQSV